MHARTKPTLVQQVHYVFGGTLPPSMADWVIADLTGPGATRRYLLRFLLPVIPPLCLFMLLPGPLWMQLSMMSLLYVPHVYFTIALLTVYRRHRLAKHGLDPDLANQEEIRRRDAERVAYERRYGRA